MTLTCPGPSCPFCAGTVCRTCPREEGSCEHDVAARHRGHGGEEPASNRVPTKQIPPLPKIPLGARVMVELRDPDDVEETAIFLETLAKLIRLRRKITLICE